MSNKIESTSGNYPLTMERNGVTYQVSLKVGTYPSTGNMDVQLILTDKLGQKSVLPLSMDVDEVCRQNCTIVNIGEKDAELLGWLNDNNVFYSTGRYSKAGYPEVRYYIYDYGNRPELDPEGFAAYTDHFEKNRAEYREMPQVNGGKFPLIVTPDCKDFNAFYQKMLNKDARASVYDLHVMLMYGETAYYSDADAFLSDIILTVDFIDPEDSNQDRDYCENNKLNLELAEQLRIMWHVSHDSFDDFLRLIGLTPSQLCKRFCIPQQTVMDWANGAEDIPSYVRLMLAEAVGALDIRWWHRRPGN